MNNIFNSVQILPVFKLAKILSLVAVLLTVTISESRAAPAGCIGAEDLDCGWKCDSCEDGYELYDTCWFQSCRRKCAANETRNIGGACVKTTGDPGDVAVPGGWITPSACSNGGGYKCRSSYGELIDNCCYKTEGDTTTVYPDDKSQEYDPSDAAFPANKNLVISSGATDFNCPHEKTYENVYISEGVGMRQRCHCCFNIRDDLNFVIPDSGIRGLNFQNIVKFACLGDIDACKQNIGPYSSADVVAATESQCNTSGSYYFTGSSCEHRPTDGTDITCEHEISGYVKVGNYCVSPENSYAKKHYTPAEAAQWLHDGNDNFVILTFKK